MKFLVQYAPRTHLVSRLSLHKQEQREERPCKTLGCACLQKRDAGKKSRTSRCTERAAHRTRRPLLTTSKLTSFVPKIRVVVIWTLRQRWPEEHASGTWGKTHRKSRLERVGQRNGAFVSDRVVFERKCCNSAIGLVKCGACLTDI